MAIDPTLLLGLMRASPQMLNILKTLINQRNYDAGVMADNLTPELNAFGNENNGEMLTDFVNKQNDFARYGGNSLSNLGMYLKDATNNTKGTGISNIVRQGPSEDQIQMYANRPDLLQKYYGNSDDIYARSMRLGAFDARNDNANPITASNAFAANPSNDEKVQALLKQPLPDDDELQQIYDMERNPRQQEDFSASDGLSEYDLLKLAHKMGLF